MRVSVDRQAIRPALGQPEMSRYAFFASIAGLYVIIIAMLALAWISMGTLLHLLILPVAFIVIGVCQYVLAQAAHEAAHFHLKPGSMASNMVAWLVFYMIGVTTDYQRTHMAHHTHFGNSEQDPDYPVYMRKPESRRAFRQFLLQSLSGLSACQRFLQVNATQSSCTRPPRGHRQMLLKLIVTQLGVLAAFSLFFPWVWLVPVYYIGLWILPLVTIVKTLIDVRLLAEHGGENAPALRTFAKRDWVTRILGAYGFQHHAEHHLFAQFPCRQLPAISGQVKKLAAPAVERWDIEYIDGNHLDFLRGYYRSLPEEAHA